MLAVSRLESALQREHELYRYRREVERELGTLIYLAKDDDDSRFFRHVERCFDWGVSAPACARTWGASDEAR